MQRRVQLLFLAPALFLALPAHAEVVSGTVLGPDGKPVANAKIVLLTYSPDPEKPSPSATSDAAGVWKLSVPDPTPEAKARGATSVLVLVHAKGFALTQSIAGPKPSTLTLQKGTGASGVVLDAKAKPVANVLVRLESVNNSGRGAFNPFDYLRLEAPLNADFSARTGADGRWNLDDLPTAGEARFRVADSKYIAARTTAKLSAEPAQAAPITLRLGATLSGRVVDESGKPVAGASIVGGMERGATWSGDSARTAADGTYKLESLAAGVHKVEARDENLTLQEQKEVAWVAASIEDALAVEGREIKLPDIVASQGAIVTGKVFDAETGAPLASVGVANSKGNNWGRSDKKGLYRLRVLPGKASIYIGGKPAGYLYPEMGNPSRTMPVTLKQGESKIINWKLPRAEQAQGVILGEDRKPVGQVTLRLRPTDDRRWGDDGESVSSDAKGAWKTYQGLKPGQYVLAGDDNWEVISPTQIGLPQKGALQVLVRRLTSQALDVRAVTPDGKPIPQVALKFSISVPQGGGTSHGNDEQGETDAQGKFSLGKLRPDYHVSLQATRVGYKYLRGGNAEYKDGAWTSEDIVMMPLLGRATGRVVDAKGQPVQGAKIFSPDAAGSQATSDAEGRWSLEALPEGEITLVATAESGAAAKLSRAGDAELALALRPQQRISTPDRDTAYEILEEVWETSRGSDWRRRATLPAEYSADDLDLALKLALSAGEDKDTGASLAVQTLITKLLEVDAARAIEWAPAQLALIKSPLARLNSTIEIGLAAAKSNPALAAQMFAQAKAIPLGQQDDEALGAALVAALAARIGSGEADALTDKALRLAKVPGDRLLDVANVLARGSAGAAARAIEAFPPLEPGDNASQAYFYVGLIEALAQHDMNGALALLDKLEALPDSQAEFSFGRAALKLIPLLGARDPAAALALARRVRNEEGDKAPALALAARFQPKAQALELLREAARSIPESYWIVASTLGQIAAQAHELDAQTGAELFARGRDKMQALMDEKGSWRQQQGAREVAVFAFHLARSNPNQSRALLEEEWAFQKSLPPDVRQFSRLDDLAIAMVAIDPVRAREMAWQSGGFGGQSTQFQAQMRIARLLMNPQVEESKLFSER